MNSEQYDPKHKIEVDLNNLSKAIQAVYDITRHPDEDLEQALDRLYNTSMTLQRDLPEIRGTINGYTELLERYALDQSCNHYDRHIEYALVDHARDFDTAVQRVVYGGS